MSTPLPRKPGTMVGMDRIAAAVLPDHLPRSAKSMLQTIWRYSSRRDGACTASMRTLGADNDIGERQARRLIDGLADAVLIESIRRVGRTAIVRINWPVLGSLNRHRETRQPRTPMSGVGGGRPGSEIHNSGHSDLQKRAADFTGEIQNPGHFEPATPDISDTHPGHLRPQPRTPVSDEVGLSREKARREDQVEPAGAGVPTPSTSTDELVGDAEDLSAELEAYEQVKRRILGSPPAAEQDQGCPPGCNPPHPTRRDHAAAIGAELLRRFGGHFTDSGFQADCEAVKQ